MGIPSRTVPNFVLTLVLILVLVPVLLQPVPAYPQGITTAALFGRILDDSGAPLPDATVVALHEPTGVSSGVFSRADGRYNIAGLRTGGPYEIRVSYIGYRTAVRQDILLTMGQSLRADFQLDRDLIEAGEITVTAHRDEVLNASNTGTETHVSAIEIARLPSIARSIQDYTRLAPEAASKAGGQSIAGKNNRMNNFQVDGAVLNDAFGLTGEGLPTGQVDAQPISLDAIEEFQVHVAPFDVRSGGFAGGLINAVTRSGTNRFRGSLYWFGRNESLVGDLDGDEFGDFTDYQLGFRLGGPVARNRAFFFVNGELRRRSSPSSAGPADSDQPIRFGGNSADLQRIVDIAREKYGYDAGGYDPYSQDTRNEKIFARLDVNLSPGHRLTLRHNLVNGDLDDGLNRGRTLFTLTSNQFKRDNVTHSSVVQLNSTFSRSLANEARISYSRVRDKRSPLSASFPQVGIDLEEPGGAFLGEVRLGVERFSQANTLDQDTFEFTNDLHLFRADHTITIGTHNEFVSFDNLFIQDYYGAYEFDGIEAFEQGTPTRYLLSRSSVPGVEQPRAAWDYVQLGFYVQDSWKVSPRLSLNFGLRTDVPILPDEPLANDRFARQFAGHRTDRTPDGQVLWSPRFGFNLDAGGDRGTQIRGGAGVFAGLPPAVWLSNAYSNSGVDFTRIDLATFRDQEVPAFVADPFAQPLPLDAGLSAPQTSEVNVIDPAFRLPRVFRTNLALDRRLPLDLVGTVEVLLARNLDEVRFRNLNIGDAGRPTGVTPDGRPDYGGRKVSGDFTNVILLENTDRGRQFNLTLRLRKGQDTPLLPGLFGSVAYVFQDAEDINSGRSSRAISNWQYNETDDPNGETTATSDFEVRHRVLASGSWKFEIGQGLPTTVSVFYEGSAGDPYSYMYADDVNGDGIRGNDLAYIPASRIDVSTEVTDDEWRAVDAFIDSDPTLRAARGGIVRRNASRSPWRNRLDLRLIQQLPSVRNQHFELTLDVLNLTNLFNSDWGQSRYVRFDAASLFNFDGYDEQGRPDLDLRVRDANEDGRVDREDVFQTTNLSSRWQVQAGVRYTF
ncbi:MAG: carboxypeptidase regulatory-like domain-containing protein [Gemmatimonadetes bacterium]|nr:carboxypeptidase regulatory-like domain-containing protein [Gemmatimonadota bacterium]